MATVKYKKTDGTIISAPIDITYPIEVGVSSTTEWTLKTVDPVTGVTTTITIIGGREKRG